MSEFSRVAEAAAFIHRQVAQFPRTAIVLGSGLGGFASTVTRPVAIPYEQIPHWPASSVPGHEGRLVLGVVAGRAVAVLSGRTHAYEGCDLKAVTFGIRVMATLGVGTFVLTSAAGGIGSHLVKGRFMILDDHINLLGGNPLIGPHEERFGRRFPDMSECIPGAAPARRRGGGRTRYSGCPGVYAAVHRPSYETPAEVQVPPNHWRRCRRHVHRAGAIVARQMGAQVVGISCITNMAAGVAPGPLDHGDVLETARETDRRWSRCSRP